MRTEANLTALCDRLHVNCGDLYDACRSVGISVLFVNRWSAEDTEVADALKEAQRVGAMGIYTEIVRRAVRGHDEPVFFKGVEVGTRKVYSDGLLGKLAEAKLPEFAKNSEGGGNTFNGPTQINIMPRAESYEQWLEMQRATAIHAAAPSLPAPEQQATIDAEFTVLPQSPFAGLGI